MDVFTQISTSVKQTTVVVVLDTAASTPWAATRVPPVVLKDTKETENIVEVRRHHRNFFSANFVQTLYSIL